MHHLVLRRRIGLVAGAFVRVHAAGRGRGEVAKGYWGSAWYGGSKSAGAEGEAEGGEH
jgi:hypothetical protein